MNAPMPVLDTEPRLVGSIRQAVAVLRYLGSRQQGAGVNAIARAVGIGPSSCFNVLKTLAAEDLVAFDPATKGYTLGLGTIDLARSALGHDAMVDAARPAMARLAARCDAAVGLWRVTARERLTLVALAESASATRIHLVVGQRQPAAAGASGRAVLAARGIDEAAVRDAYRDLRWQQAPGEDAYVDEVAEARGRGWAIDAGFINRGVTTIAAAIRDGGGAVSFSLTASMFTGRHAADELAAAGAAVRDAAHALSATRRVGDR